MRSDWRVLAVAVLVAVAFGGVASGGPATSSAEPISSAADGVVTGTQQETPDAGDTKENATEVELGDTLSGQIDAADDRADWYKLDVPAGTIVRLTGNAETIVFGGSEFEGLGGFELLTEEDGTLFVKAGFIGTCGRGPCTDNYTITITGIDAREPNDGLDSAVRIDRNATLTDNLSVDRPFADEIDTFAFGLTAGDRTTVTFERDTPDGVTLLRVIGPDGATVASRYVASTDPTTLRVDAEQDGTYRVQAVVVSDRPRETVGLSETRVINYTLTLDTTPGADDAPRFTRDEYALAKYDRLFSELSVETQAEIAEIVRRQPLADGLGPADVQTRDEIAWALYGLPYDALSGDRQATVDEQYLAQFAG